MPNSAPLAGEVRLPPFIEYVAQPKGLIAGSTLALVRVPARLVDVGGLPDPVSFPLEGLIPNLR
jgi:hypothetical protein